MNHKYREQQRFALGTPVPVLIHRQDKQGENQAPVEGMLLDAGEQSMGIVVLEPLELTSLCIVEVCDEDAPEHFRGEVCYLANTEYGVRLGILLFDEGDMPFLDYLMCIGVRLK
ncbi:hypothetical protein [Gallaecimonas xiamenensis]|uniref:PilZ domain-containing protein n=1 Tax=Gallaecimonas xiamenensis 3-C-1 TaxID=745411 RepID=K2J6C7_9GAMM|nr:hypothetical protein [Gallaecimonas xiamenensis]EKE70598.1 hypothetical protein B3C1_13708 [Gallaecimonas xiamenensis 3-C-1]